MSNAHQDKKIEKILILGLDNSGKTSILLTLQKEVNLLSFYSLKPTHGINIVTIEDENANTKYSIWEFGGQKQYREDYLKNLQRYTQEATKIIYVIDVQDINRYDLALDYFKSIFELLDLKKDNIQLSIFLHKFDPHLENNEEFSYKKISSRLLNKISAIIPPGYSYSIFKTTIYTVFQKTLLESV
ncbi:MAG: ADP-ribosylation factor-like protein [Candidatus Helarchaeota archaeon]